MITDMDIYHSARVLMGQYGDRALLEAMNRVEKYRGIQNESGMNVWRRIADVIEALQIPPHLSTQTVH
jgi:hypothetical protein